MREKEIKRLQNRVIGFYFLVAALLVAFSF